MVLMAIPYKFVLTMVGMICIQSGLLESKTAEFYEAGIISHHTGETTAPSNDHH